MSESTGHGIVVPVTTKPEPGDASHETARAMSSGSRCAPSASGADPGGARRASTFGVDARADGADAERGDAEGFGRKRLALACVSLSAAASDAAPWTDSLGLKGEAEIDAMSTIAPPAPLRCADNRNEACRVQWNTLNVSNAKVVAGSSGFGCSSRDAEPFSQRVPDARSTIDGDRLCGRIVAL